jgi:hypothetical protein
MLNDSRTFSLSRSGRAYMHFLLAFNSHDEGQLQVFIQKNFAPSFQKQTPVDEMVKWCLDTYKSLGVLKIHKVFFSEEFFIIVIVVADDGTQYLHKLKIQDSPPYQITEYFHEDT